MPVARIFIIPTEFVPPDDMDITQVAAQLYRVSQKLSRSIIIKEVGPFVLTLWQLRDLFEAQVLDQHKGPQVFTF